MSNEEAHAVEDHELEMQRMHRCLDMSRQLIDLIKDAMAGALKEGPLVATLLDREKLDVIFEKDGNPPLSTPRYELIINVIGNILSVLHAEQRSLYTCDIWHVAHSLHHIVYDEDLPTY